MTPIWLTTDEMSIFFVSVKLKRIKFEEESNYRNKISSSNNSLNYIFHQPIIFEIIISLSVYSQVKNIFIEAYPFLLVTVFLCIQMNRIYTSTLFLNKEERFFEFV